MATSGTSIFNTTRNEICSEAAKLLNAVPLQQTMGAAMFHTFNFFLNAMVKSWQATGIHLWTTIEGTLFPIAGQVRYGVGGATTDHITGAYYETAVTANEAAAQTVISVDLTTNVAALDNIGIVLDDGTMHWTTVVSKSASTVTILAALPSAAAAGNVVFTYTAKLPRLLKVVDARRYDIVGATDTPMTVCSRQEYNNLPMKTQAGTPIQMFYDAQLTTGYLNVWQIPDTPTQLVKFTAHRPIQDFTSSGDNPDLPQEWILPLVYNLAKMKMPSHPVDAQRRRDIIDNADSLLAAMIGYDRENESYFVQPDMEGYQ